MQTVVILLKQIQQHNFAQLQNDISFDFVWKANGNVVREVIMYCPVVQSRRCSQQTHNVIITCLLRFVFAG